MKFSVIIPVYNDETHIEKAIESVLGQTYGYLELILVDDGSTDTTGQICDRYAAKNSNISVIHKKNGGVTSAWKAGVEAAKYDYVGFCDSDDWLDLAYYSNANEAIESTGADMFVCGYKTVESSPCVIPASLHGLRGLVSGEELQWVKTALLGCEQNDSTQIQFAKWIKVIKKQIVLNNWKYYDEIISYGDDVAVTIASALDSRAIYFSDQILYYYLMRENSITHQRFQVSRIEEFERLYKLIVRILNEKGYSNDFALCHEGVKMVISLSLMAAAEKSNSKKDIFESIRSTSFAHGAKDYQKFRFPFKKRIFLTLFLKKCYSTLYFLIRVMRGRK